MLSKILLKKRATKIVSTSARNYTFNDMPKKVVLNKNFVKNDDGKY